MELSIFVILKIAVLRARNSRIRHKIVLNSTLCRWFKVWRLMISGWWRLRHLVGSWSWGRAVVQDGAKSSIRGLKAEITCWRLFVSSKAWLLVFFSRHISKFFWFQRDVCPNNGDFYSFVNQAHFLIHKSLDQPSMVWDQEYIESRKFPIAVVLSWPWYILFRFKVLINNFLFIIYFR